MTTLKSAMLALTMISMMGACGGDDMATFKSLVDEMCQCEDMACFEKVQARGKKTIGKKKMEALRESNADEVANLFNRMVECGMKLEPAAAAPAVAPVPEAPPAPAPEAPAGTAE